MKLTLFVLCLLCATAAVGQSGAVYTNPMQFAGHSDHAGPAGLAQEQNLWGSSGSVVSAKGEQPVGEVVPEKYEMPLGDAARILRKEHSSDRKAQVLWENRAWGPGLAMSTAGGNWIR
jgi:hypothetical protein